MAAVSEAGGEATCGLVSVPTRGKPRGVEVQELRERLRAFAPDPHQSRMARLRRAVGFSARAIASQERGRAASVPVMVTLTYRPGEDWQANHIKGFMQNVRKWHQQRGIACRYVWVGELQERGALHYHVVLWVPRGTKLPKPDARGWWPYGMTQRIVCTSAIGYLLSYLKKDKASEFARFPKGVRSYGVGGLEPGMRRARAWLALPGFVQARASVGDVWRRVTGGGWRSPDGSVWPSEFVRTVVGDAPALIRVRDHGRPFVASGPFSWAGAGA
jgi:hypothetical protein